MANYIKVRPSDFSDGISNTLIPTSADSTLVQNVRFCAMTECPRLRFTCTGTQFQVQLARDSVFVGVANYNDVPVFVDGSATPTYAGKITPGASSTTAWYTFSGMSAGAHVIEIQGGQGNLSGSKMVGT